MNVLLKGCLKSTAEALEILQLMFASVSLAFLVTDTDFAVMLGMATFLAAEER